MAMSANEINERLTGELQESARDMRTRFIADVTEVTLEALAQQELHADELALLGYPDGEVLDLMVMEDEIALQFIDEQPQSALRILLTSTPSMLSYMDPRLANQSDEVERMELFLPLEEPVRLDEHFDITEVKPRTTIFVKRVKSDGITAWFQVSPESMRPYVPEAESAIDPAVDDVLDDIAEDNLDRILSGVVEIGMGQIGKLREDFLNFRLTPLRRLMIIDGNYVDTATLFEQQDDTAVDEPEV